MPRPGLEPGTHGTKGERSNHCATEAHNAKGVYRNVAVSNFQLDGPVVHDTRRQRFVTGNGSQSVVSANRNAGAEPSSFNSGAESKGFNSRRFEPRVEKKHPELGCAFNVKAQTT
jgi:hypothetical protein